MEITLNNIVDPSENDGLPQTFQKLHQRIQEAFKKKPECFEPVLQVENPSPNLVRRLSHVKRFLELWSADPEIRASASTDAQATIDSLGLDLVAEEIRFLYDEAYCRDRLRAKDWKAPLIAQQYRLWVVEKLISRERIKLQLAKPASPKHRAWRERQIHRTTGQLGKTASTGIVHAPFAIELSDGCSVGCWFCGVSAEKRKRDFEWNPANAELWRGVVHTLAEVIGPAASQGFCYWATDPLDNPHYENFCADFAHITGRFPQTTTAQPQKHIERVRTLLIHSRSLGCEINRFSILSLPILKKIHQAFTPEELLWTELITQNMEATSMQSNSGRARKSNRLEQKANHVENLPDTWREAPGTIACVSGFLLNMVSLTVRLVTPAPSSDRWPNGFWILEEQVFRDGDHLREILLGMIERNMPAMPRLDGQLSFRHDIQFVQKSDHAFELQSYGLFHTYSDSPERLGVGKALARRDLTCREIILQAEDKYGMPSEEAMIFLCQLFDAGLLDEEPAPATTSPTTTALPYNQQQTQPSQ